MNKIFWGLVILTFLIALGAMTKRMYTADTIQYVIAPVPVFMTTRDSIEIACEVWDKHFHRSYKLYYQKGCDCKLKTK